MKLLAHFLIYGHSCFESYQIALANFENSQNFPRTYTHEMHSR